MKGYLPRFFSAAGILFFHILFAGELKIVSGSHRAKQCEVVVAKIADISQLQGTLYTGSFSQLSEVLAASVQGNAFMQAQVKERMAALNLYLNFVENYQGKSSAVLHLKAAIEKDPHFINGGMLVCGIGKDCDSMGLNFLLSASTDPTQVRVVLFHGTAYPEGMSPDEVTVLKSLVQNEKVGGHFMFLEAGASVETIFHELGHYANALLLKEWIEANQKLAESDRDQLFKKYTRRHADGVLELDLGFFVAFEESQAQGNFLELQNAMRNAGRIDLDVRAAEQTDAAAYLWHVVNTYEDSAHWVVAQEKIDENNFFHVGRSWASQMRATIAKSKN